MLEANGIMCTHGTLFYASQITMLNRIFLLLLLLSMYHCLKNTNTILFYKNIHILNQTMANLGSKIYTWHQPKREKKTMHAHHNQSVHIYRLQNIHMHCIREECVEGSSTESVDIFASFIVNFARKSGS